MASLETNPLQYRPDLRKRVYAAAWAVGLGLGAAQVGYASVEAGTPEWLRAALGVHAFLAAGVGYTAGRNVSV